jgi:hypothetical protein
VILDQYYVTAHSEGLTQEFHNVFGVVKDIDEHDCVKAGVSERDMPTIKGLHGDPGFVPDQDVDPLNQEIRAKARDEMGDESVTTANVQDTSVLWYQARQVGAQHARSPLGDVMPMGEFGNSHFLPRAIMLTMKLEKIV